MALRIATDALEMLLDEQGFASAYLAFRSAEFVALRTHPVENQLVPPPLILRHVLAKARRLRATHHVFNTPQRTAAYAFGLTRHLIVVGVNPPREGRHSRAAFRGTCMSLREQFVQLLRGRGLPHPPDDTDDGGIPTWPVVPPPPFRPR